MALTIYALKDPSNGEVRYVGKTNDLRVRINQHLQDRSQSHKSRWLRPLSEPPSVEVLEILDADANWPERERYWIAHYRSLGARLTNLTDGGEGWKKADGHSEETKAKLRELALARGAKPPSQKGRKASAETREKLSKARKEQGTRPPPRGGWNKGYRKSHCVNNHELTPENRYYRDGRYRGCQTCLREASKRRSQKQKDCPTA